jgi:hypothetical protein
MASVLVMQELISQITLAVRAEVKGEVERAVEKLVRKFDDLDEGVRWVYFLSWHPKYRRFLRYKDEKSAE